MKNSKLIALLRTFDKREWEAFSRFIASPYFNSRDDLLPLFNYLKQLAPDLPDKLLERTRVYKKIYPRQVFDEKHLGYLMSYLCKLIEQFFQIQKYEADTTTSECHLLSALLDRKLLKFYRQEAKKIDSKLQKATIRDSAFYYKKYLMSELEMLHFEMHQVRKHNHALQAASNYLDRFYFTNKLRQSCTMLNDQQMISTTYQMAFLEEIQTYLTNNTPEKEPSIQIYLLTLEMLNKENTDAGYKALKEFIQKQGQLIARSDAQYIYHQAINYCARKIRKGERHFANEALELYLDGIQKEVFFEKGILSPWIYKNVIVLALGLGKYDGIEDFIQTYSSRLDKEFQEDALHYNLANLYYHRKEYDKSMSNLMQIQYTDVAYNLGSKVMLLKIYYEIDEEEPLLSLLASFSLYLKRNKKVSKDVKETYLNFCNILNRIMRKNPKRIPAIKEQIMQSKLLTERRWLVEKVKHWESGI